MKLFPLAGLVEPRNPKSRQNANFKIASSFRVFIKKETFACCQFGKLQK